MKVENVIFDFNGTLLDDCDMCLELLNEMLEIHGYDKVTKSFYLEVFDFPVRDYYYKSGFQEGVDDFNELSKYFNENYLDRFKYNKLHEGVKETLEALKKKGINLIILSASEQSNLDNQVNSLGIKDYFSNVLGTTSTKGVGKTRVAEEFIKNNHLDTSKTLMVGDTLHDKLVAEVLNCKPILFSKGHVARHRLEESGATIIDNFKDLLSYID